MCIYLDNMLMLHHKRGQLHCTTGDPTHLQIIQELRVNGEQEKSILMPTQELKIIGFHQHLVTTRLLILSQKN